MVKASKQILCLQEKVLVGIQNMFVFTDNEFSLISGFTKIVCSPEDPQQDKGSKYYIKCDNIACDLIVKWILVLNTVVLQTWYK